MVRPSPRRGDLHAHTDLYADREVEPFDEALDRETWSLYNQHLQWDLELATKRRKRPQEISDLFENLFKARAAPMGELDEPAEEEEDRADPSLPDGQLVVQLAWLVADIGQKPYLHRQGMRSPMWLVSPRVYPRCGLVLFPDLWRTLTRPCATIVDCEDPTRSNRKTQRCRSGSQRHQAVAASDKVTLLAFIPYSNDMKPAVLITNDLMR